MRTRLDTLDKNIIAALEKDGRRSFRDIGHDLGVPETTVRNRVNRLVKKELIEISATGNPLKLGVNTIAISLVKVKLGQSDKVAKVLAAYPNVRFVGTTFGAADIIIQTLHKDPDNLYQFLTEEIPRAAPEVTDVQTFQLHEMLKSSWEWSKWFEGFTPAEVPKLDASV